MRLSLLRGCRLPCIQAIVVVAALSGASSFAASFLVRADSRTAPQTTAVTYAGPVEATLVPVHPSLGVTIVFMTEALRSGTFDSAAGQLIDSYSSFAGQPVRFGVLNRDSLEITAVSSRVRLRAALDNVTPSPGSTEDSIRSLDALVQNAPSLGERWSQVILVGELPEMPPAAKKYAAGLLLRTFIEQHVRVSWLATGATADSWPPLFEATGGIEAHSLNELSSLVRKAYFQANWTSPPLATGFVISDTTLSTVEGETLVVAPELVVSRETILPSIGSYVQAQAKLVADKSLVATASLTEAQLQQLTADVTSVLTINPSDVEALKLGIRVSERTSNLISAEAYGESLIKAQPEDGTAYALLGHTLLLTGKIDKAEASLRRASDLKVQTADVLTDLAKVHVARKDDAGALTYFDAALSADAQRQDVWFSQAESAERLLNSALAIRSLEKGLALGGIHVPEAGSLVRLYVNTRQQDKAGQFARTMISKLPPDPAVRREFARKLDELQLSSETLAGWRSVLDVRPGDETAEYRVSALLLASGDAQAAIEAAKAGLAVNPSSARLHVAKADALLRLGRRYDARAALRDSEVTGENLDLLTRSATVEDTYGTGASERYLQLARVLNLDPTQSLPVLERGFLVAIRDHELPRADTFAKQLSTAGHPEYSRMLGAPQSATVSRTFVLGGFEPLAYAARMPEHVPPERFLVEYCRAVINHTRDTASAAQYVKTIQDHFKTMAKLESFGHRNGNRVVIELSMNKGGELRTTEMVLNVLGIQMRSRKGKLEFDRGEKKEQARRQEMLAALAINETAMQEALQAGKSYDITLNDDLAPIYPDENMWEALGGGEGIPGGLEVAFLLMPRLARLYVGLSYLDNQSLSALLSMLNAKVLYDKYADLLYVYSASLAVQDGRVVVPGGANAEPTWAHLAAATPSSPPSFLQHLLQRDNGKLLAFFNCLSEFDLAHQRFFTANVERTSRMYKLFAEAVHVRGTVVTSQSEETFVAFLRSIPLGADGRVRFPGSPELWMTAKGNVVNPSEVDKLSSKRSSVVAPAVEDAILSRLAQTHYKEQSTRHTELENFGAVSRIDSHRREPLDATSAYLLSQLYGQAGQAFDFFTELTSVDLNGFRQFFAVLDSLERLPHQEQNLRMGQLNSLIAWLCLMQVHGSISEKTAAELFSDTMRRFSSAEHKAPFASASLESAQAILKACTADSRVTADERLRNCFLGTAARQPVRSRAYLRVLEMQKAPDLASLLKIYEDLQRLASTTTDKGEVAEIRKLVSTFPSVELPANLKLPPKEKDGLKLYDLAALKEAVEHLGQKADKRKPDPKGIQRASQEVLAELEPQVVLALAGPVYSYYLRPDDLVVSQDPLLLRKHRYVDFAAMSDHPDLVAASEFERNSERAGSYFLGGFAQFGVAAGEAASAGWKAASTGEEEIIAAEITALRESQWDNLQESDQRLAHLRVLTAREWIVEASRRPAEFRSLSEETLGLLSLSRRSELLSGILNRNWDQVWRAITLPDLFALGGRYLVRYSSDPWTSPVTDELRSISKSNDGSRLRALAGVPYHIAGCAHPHLMSLAPYEEYERHMFPTEIAERMAEFKIFLAVQSDRAGLEPTAVAEISEDLAATMLGKAILSDGRDWRGLSAAYATLAPEDVRQALVK